MNFLQQYHCQSCGHTWEAINIDSDQDTECPFCHSLHLEMFHAEPLEDNNEGC